MECLCAVNVHTECCFWFPSLEPRRVARLRLTAGSQSTATKAADRGPVQGGSRAHHVCHLSSPSVQQLLSERRSEVCILDTRVAQWATHSASKFDI